MRVGPLRVVVAAVATLALLVAPSVAGAARHGASTKKIDCTARPVPGIDLRGCNLSHRQFPHVNLTGANLSKANLTGSSLYNDTLFGTNLSGANLTDANLATANLTGARLNKANIFGATIVQTDFAETSLISVSSGDLHGRPTSLPGRYFTKRGVLFGPGVDLKDQWLVHLDLAHANLSRANLTGANLARANLSHTSLSGTRMLGAILTGAVITDTGFHDALLFKPNRKGVRTGGLIGHPRKLPEGFSLADGYFIGPGANLHHAQLRKLFLPKVNFTGADLDDANFEGTILWGAEFSVTAMQRTGFSHASLQNANFSNVSIASANLHDAILSGLRSSAVRSRRLPPGWVNVNGHLVGPSADLAGDNLGLGRFGPANLAGANLRGANLTGAFMAGTRLAGSFSGRLIVRVIPPKLPPRWIVYRGFLLGPGANLPAAGFQNAILPTIDLSAAQLFGTDLQNANLQHANLTHASLVGVNLQNANLSRAALGGIRSLQLRGRPASLPHGWAVVGGSLVHR